MMKSGFLFVYTVMLLLVSLESCNNSAEGVVKYDKFSCELELNSDSVSTQSLYDNLYVDFVDGCMVVSSCKADTMMHFYSTPALNYEFSAGAKGHSVNEMESFPSFAHSMTKYLYVRGYTANTLRKFTITDGKLVDAGVFKLSLIDIPNDMHVIKDSLLYYNDLSNMGVKSYNLKTGKSGNEWKLSSLYGKVNNKDVLMGTLCANDSLSLYALQYKREIVVLRTTDLSYVKTISWDYENQDELVGGDPKKTRLYYTYGFSTGNHFYFLCRDAVPRDKNAHFSIEEYDKDLKPVCKYVLDKKIFSFVVDEKNKYIYGFGENEDYIRRFKIKS